MSLSHLPPEHSLGNIPVELVLTIGDFLTQADRSALSRTAVRFCEILTLVLYPHNARFDHSSAIIFAAAMAISTSCETRWTRGVIPISDGTR